LPNAGPYGSRLTSAVRATVCLRRQEEGDPRHPGPRRLHTPAGPAPRGGRRAFLPPAARRAPLGVATVDPGRCRWATRRERSPVARAAGAGV